VPAPKEVLKLIERFERNRDAYRSHEYNETQLRREFIDPLFKALGWDVTNEKGYAEAYKEVIHEDAIKVGGATKAPDYCFRIGGTRKFFVEAKRPSVGIKDDPIPAYQLRRYAWSAKLPLSILTDFEEFAVYDCRVKPAKTDKASAARILYITYTEYAERWDEIALIFSQEAILTGSFDRYVESTKRKRGTAEVDDAFLKEIENWRDVLARNIALRNADLSTRELNFAVQRTIDRIIFLRICEDRGIEDYGQLMALQSGSRVYPRLCQILRRADERYNSGLFHFRKEKDRPEPPDDLTLSLTVDDKVLKEVFKDLYYPDSPYEFSVLPADILGHIYEQFLGKVIRLTSGHHAKVEDKPEVKKAGGVYYTPTYIVDYIVEYTVGKLLEKKTPQQASKLRILDPACGSGSFLLVAYQTLLDWHLKWYAEYNPEKHARGRKPKIFHGPGGDWRLTTSEKKRILLNNIYGVDIDPQAVEVTKLSLLLKVLEGENAETLGKSLRLFHERALPDLGENIKCGNSLIGPDFYEGKQLNLLDEEERYRINAFDWAAEFPEIMENGGFDAVIGNPPYIFTRERITEEERVYFSARYNTSWEKQNTYMLFMELLSRLLAPHGRGGLIVPNSWLTIESAHLLRSLLVPCLVRVDDLNYPVFSGVSMEPSIFVMVGIPSTEPVMVLRADSKKDFLETARFSVDRRHWENAGGRIVFAKRGDASSVVDRVVDGAKGLGELFEVWSGLQAYEKGKGTPPQTARDVAEHVFDRDEKEDENSYHYLQGRDVGRYSLRWSGMWMQYGPWLAQPRSIGIFTRPRVLLREITGKLPYCLSTVFTYEAYLNNKSVLNILHEDDSAEALKCLCAVLNSRLTSLYYKQRAVKSTRRFFPKVVIRNLREFPFPAEISDREKAKLVELVDDMLGACCDLQSAKTDHDRSFIQRQIAATDKQINQLVYELYGLTDEEIRIVEEATK